MKSKWQLSEFGPPDMPGVYAVVVYNAYTKSMDIVYIGSSRNIHKRVMNPNHPYRKLNDIISFPYFISVKYKVCDNYIDLEKSLIKRLKPKYNLQHTGIEFRSYKIKI